MDKKELISLTIGKMLDRFKSSPESFELHGTFMPSMGINEFAILWRPKIELEPNMATTVNDPLNDSAVIIKLSIPSSEITCYLYSKAPTGTWSSYNGGSQADSTVTLKLHFITWRNLYRQFMKLHNNVVMRDLNNENKKYMKKLNSIFPDAIGDMVIKK